MGAPPPHNFVQKHKAACLLLLLLLTPDVAGAVASGVADLVGQGRAARLFAEVHKVLLVQGHAAVHGVHVDLQKPRALAVDTTVVTS